MSYDDLPEGALLFTDYDDAIIGVSHDDRIIYDYDKIVTLLIKKGCSEDEAIEWIDYNMIGSIQNDNYPIIMYSL